eukprot:7380174-Prymnesium_polylepis.4
MTNRYWGSARDRRSTRDASQVGLTPGDAGLYHMSRNMRTHRVKSRCWATSRRKNRSPSRSMSRSSSRTSRRRGRCRRYSSMMRCSSLPSCPTPASDDSRAHRDVLPRQL